MSIEAINAAIAASRERESKGLHPPVFSDWDEEALRVAYINGGLARAVYGLQCRYVGPHHEEVSVRLIEDAIRVVNRTFEPRFRDALEVAVEELTHESTYVTGMTLELTPAARRATDTLTRIAAILAGNASAGEKT